MEKEKVAAIVGLVAAFLFMQMVWRWYQAPTCESLLADVEVPARFRERGKEFKKQVVTVTDGIHMAIGYALGNSIMIDAPEGVIIVDTTESLEAAREIVQEFRKINQKHIKGIIYTHNHADHIYGAKAFIEDPTDPPQIWAHHTLLTELQKVSTVSTTHFVRAMRQFGVLLPKQVNQGVGFNLRIGANHVGMVLPNKLMKGDVCDLTIAGLNMKLVHIPGETPDHIGVWLPDKRAFLCGDDYYKAFPNLYAIRGTGARDVQTWVKSIDIIRKLRPEYLIPSHTNPVIGENTVYSLLTQYRDAIQLVHDQTVRFMNHGLLPDEIVEKVKLPPKFDQLPFLQEHYGTLEWSVRGVFNTYMGWFSGDPVELSPLSRAARAQRIVELAGGVNKVLDSASKALDKDDPRWALELVSHVFLLNPQHEYAKAIRLRALKKMASIQTSTNGRNYYLTWILEDYGFVENKKPDDTMKTKMVKMMKVSDILKAMRLRLKAEECYDIEQVAVLEFTDTKEKFQIYVRNGIAEITTDNIDTEKIDVKVILTAETFKDLVSKVRSPVRAYMAGDVKIQGGVFNFRRFMGLFDID